MWHVNCPAQGSDLCPLHWKCRVLITKEVQLDSALFPWNGPCTGHTWSYYALLYCTSQIFLFFFNWRFVATFCQASLLAQFFQQHLFTSCLCITFWQFLQYFKIFHYYSICYSGLGSLISDVIVIIVLGTTNCSQIEDKHSQCCVSSGCFHFFSPSPWVSLFPETQQYWN